MATVRELADACRVNRNTAARAVRTLRREGLVITRVGRGTFVSGDPPAFDPAESGERLDRRIDGLLYEAHSLGVPFEQIPSRLWTRIEEFRRQRSR